jgi:hypothetical protein
MTVDQPQDDPAATPSPSTVAYLFADRFVLAEKPGKTGQRAWGTGAVVVTNELSAGLVAIGLWQLREMGAVTIEPYSGKRMGFIPVSGVRLRLVGTAEVGGVEKRLLDFLQTHKKAKDEGVTAWDVANMISRDTNDPRGSIIKPAMDEAVALGYLQREQQEVGVMGRLAGKPGTRLEPQTDRLATLQPAAQRLAEQWRDFRSNEADVAKLLRSTSFDGIEVRVRDKRSSDLDD